MPRKKRILIITISIILVISVIVGIFIFLLLKTDLLKTKEELFSKYFVQNFQILDALSLDNKEIDNTLENNKYSSILYDMYICKNGKAVKLKNEKFTCEEIDGIDVDNNNTNENTNTESNNTNNNNNNTNSNNNNNTTIDKNKTNENTKK